MVTDPRLSILKAYTTPLHMQSHCLGMTPVSIEQLRVTILYGLVVILSGALFYATVRFSFVQKYFTLSTMLSIILAKCTLKCIKCTFSPLKTNAKPNYHPIFYCR
jgi:hypothetical protein